MIAIVATLDEELSKIYDAGIDLVLSLVTHPMDLETAIKEVEVNAIHAGETAIRAFLLNNKIEDGANL